MLDESRLKQEMENSISWIRGFVSKSGAKGVVVGNSGGKDSGVVIAMATKALGKDNVITVAMPCNGVARDMEDAKEVVRTFGVKMLDVNIAKGYSELENEINSNLQELSIELSKEAKINMKPRIRMLTLYSIAQTLGYLVIGTGNLCERMVGYTTKWGDNSSDFNPIANFTVQEVLKIGEYLGVPQCVLTKAPADGLGLLTDEEKMGVTYKQIAEYIETGKTDVEAMGKIEQKYNSSKHKRKLIPIYEFERDNYLEQRLN